MSPPPFLLISKRHAGSGQAARGRDNAGERIVMATELAQIRPNSSKSRIRGAMWRGQAARGRDNAGERIVMATELAQIHLNPAYGVRCGLLLRWHLIALSLQRSNGLGRNHTGFAGTFRAPNASAGQDLREPSERQMLPPVSAPTEPYLTGARDPRSCALAPAYR
jgi:hypothetical protein